MRAVLVTTLAGLLAVFVITSPKPASALPAATTTALNYSHAKADLVEVRRWYKRRYYRPYRYRYYRRPYYRPYYRRYYRPYRYYGRPYYYRPYYRPYWRRPGVSVWVGI